MGHFSKHINEDGNMDYGKVSVEDIKTAPLDELFAEADGAGDALYCCNAGAHERNTATWFRRVAGARLAKHGYPSLVRA